MNFLIKAYNVVLYQPLLNVLILFYVYLPGHDLGVAVVVLTLLIRLLLYPFSRKSIESQQALSTLQPKIKELQNKHKNNKEEQAKAMMELYRREKVSPMSGCLPLLLQLPVLIALYQVFLKGLKMESLKGALYSFVPFPQNIDAHFLGLIDLAKPFAQKLNEATQYYWPVLVLALAAAFVQFIQTKFFTPSLAQSGHKEKPGAGPDFSRVMQKQMIYFFPILIIFIVLKFGSIIGLYLLASSLFSIGEHQWIKKRRRRAAKERVGTA